MPPGHPVYCVWERGGMSCRLLSVVALLAPQAKSGAHACMNQVNNGERTKNKKGQQGTTHGGEGNYCAQGLFLPLASSLAVGCRREQRGKPGLFPSCAPFSMPCPSFLHTLIHPSDHPTRTSTILGLWSWGFGAKASKAASKTRLPFDANDLSYWRAVMTFPCLRCPLP